MTCCYRLRRFWSGCWPVLASLAVGELIMVILPPKPLFAMVWAVLTGVVGGYWGYRRRRKYWPLLPSTETRS